jgi:Arc/MetJ-type ribon-helix-helix transcriptional regulator
MPQINIHLTDEFSRQIDRLVLVGAFPSKSEAIRAAVRETLERRTIDARPADFSAWRGLAGPGRGNPRRRFRSDDDLWR